ncbi:MAG TPA: thioredoxin family protein [Burkholderiaceae bacterium]|nr:thioredoxin family protein [Burkholderiaceae bacterium]
MTLRRSAVLFRGAACTVAVTLACAGCFSHDGIAPKLNVGDAAPRSVNRVLAPGQDWRQVTTMDTRVRLYRWRIADLIEQRKPFIVVFGTPQHCTSCVDQLSRVAMVEEKYGERFAFVHVDGYKDNAVWVQWGIKGEPWTFVVDSGGRVRKVFPGQTETALLEDQVKVLLAEAGA